MSLDKDIIQAAVDYRRAMLQLLQNESELANGGRDDGSNQDTVDRTEETLDGLLRLKFGPCWDLKPIGTPPPND